MKQQVSDKFTMSAGCKILIPHCVVSGIARDLEVNYPLSLVAGNLGRKLVVGVHCKCAFTTKDIFQFSTFAIKEQLQLDLSGVTRTTIGITIQGCQSNGVKQIKNGQSVFRGLWRRFYARFQRR